MADFYDSSKSKFDKEFEKFLKIFFKSKGKQSIESYHLQTEKIEEMKELFSTVSFKNYQLNKKDKEEIWNRIERLNFTNQNDKVANRSRYAYKWLGVAAILILLISFITIFYFQSDKVYVSVVTGFGETKNVTLSDGSKVYLNANTILKYKKNNPREVWIEGEAFFKVVHTQKNDKFLVRTLDNLSVQVLGTSFDVYNRKSKVNVVLNSGKIKLHIEGKKGIIMEPGQLAQFKNSEQRYAIKKVDPSMYSSWKDKKLIFKNTSIKEIAHIIEDTYGVNVVVQSQELNNLKVSGTIINNSLDGLLYAISETVNMKVIFKNNQIILKKKN